MAKVFQILVPDNTLVSRIISCENQVTELFVIDRADKKFVSDYLSDLTKPALYILVNRDTRQLYVGETDDSYKRLKNHEAKDFWTEAIVFHSTAATLSTTEVKWLEAKTYEKLNELGYYDLAHNKQTPQYPPLKRHQIYTLEPIFEEAKNYICAAGFDIFLRSKMDDEPVVSLQTETKSHSDEKEETSSEASNVWLLPSSKKHFDLEACFNKYGEVFWRIGGNFKRVAVGDTGYIYSGTPDKAIRFSFEVVKTAMPYATEMDRDDEFAKGKDGLNSQYGAEGGTFALVKLTGRTTAKQLSLKQLLSHGLKGAPQGAQRLSQKQYEDLLLYIKDNFSQNNSKPTKQRRQPRPPFRFSMIDIKTGDKIVFIPRNIEVTVSTDKTVEYNGKQYTLTGFCKAFMPDQQRNAAEAYQGPDFFLYDGKKLTFLRNEKEKPKQSKKV